MLGITSANHTARAMMSLVPDKRVFAALETIDPLPLFRSVSATFMHLSLYRNLALLLVWIYSSKR